MKKKIMKLLAVPLVLSLVACSSGDDEAADTGDTGDTEATETVNLKVWGAQEAQDFLKDRIEDFKAENEGTDYNIELGVVGEPDARDVVTQDLDAAADVFAFANDQITDLHEAGALYEITKNKDEIVSRNVEGSVEAAMIDDSLYAYPMTADNGYFMYYDSSVFSEEDVDSLDRMIEVAEEEGRKIFFDVANGWYNASFFLGAGNTIEIDEEGVQKVDFNNEQGVKAGNFIRDFTASDAFIGGDDEVLTSQESIAAGVSGTWNAGAMQDKFGENYAATKLPTMNLDGEEKQMASFGGYKLMGVKTSTEHPLEAMALAEFLTNEESQIMRFETRELGPSNIKAAEAEAVQENIALSALAEQSEYAVSQQNVLGSFWEPAEAFGTAMIDGSDEDMQALLDEMVSQINSSNE